MKFNDCVPKNNKICAGVVCAHSQIYWQQGYIRFWLNYTFFSRTRRIDMMHKKTVYSLILNGTYCSLIRSLERIKLQSIERQCYTTQDIKNHSFSLKINKSNYHLHMMPLWEVTKWVFEKLKQCPSKLLRPLLSKNLPQVSWVRTIFCYKQ